MNKKAQLARDDRGFFRYLGGRRFRYGKDPMTATIANARLEAFWQRVSADGGSWDETTMTIARAIVKGEQECSIPPNPKMTGGES